MAAVNKRAEKMEKSREKSVQLLESLRKKRLEGLAQPLLSRPEKIVKQMEKLESIKKLVTSYWVAVKRKQELTPLRKGTILESIVKYFNKSVQMRDGFLGKPLHLPNSHTKIESGDAKNMEDKSTKITTFIKSSFVS